MNKKLIERIQEIFFEKLKLKTGWGRNELMTAYRESVNQAILEVIDK